jgi:TPR repeat protein
MNNAKTNYPHPDPFEREYETARDGLHSDTWREAVKRLEWLAESGSILSLLLIADAMRDGGWIYHRDLEGAKLWYQIGIDNGSLRALYGMGVAHNRSGDFAKALEVLEQAAARGYAPAFGALANMHYHGAGVPRDRRAAEVLWRKAASLGQLKSAMNLAACQVKGQYGLRGWLEGIVTIWPTVMAFVDERNDRPYSERLR